jgi:putative cardiolipin synthase
MHAMGRILGLVLLFCLGLCGPARAELPRALETAFAAVAQSAGGATDVSLRLLIDNLEAWFARWWLVERAKKSIDCTYFVAEDDVFCTSFMGLLLQKAKAGVQVRLMLDFRGAYKLLRAPVGQQYLRDLTSTGRVQVRIFNPAFRSIFEAFGSVRALVASNHEKILIVDGEWLVTGGRNLSNDYFARPADHPDAYRDTDLLVRGAGLAAQARQAFDREWSRRTGWKFQSGLFDLVSERTEELDAVRRLMQSRLMGVALPGDQEKRAPRRYRREIALYHGLEEYRHYDPTRRAGPFPAVLLSHTARLHRETAAISQAIERFVDEAREEIVLQSPYFILSKTGRAALARAAKRGVRIVVHTNSPTSTDNLLSQLPFILEWKELLRDIPTMRLFVTREATPVHAKVYVFDRTVSIVGTHNIDPLSDRINAENAVAVNSAVFATTNREQLKADLARSIEYRISIGADGAPVEVVGPGHVATPERMREILRLKWALVFRPLL